MIQRLDRCSRVNDEGLQFLEQYGLGIDDANLPVKENIIGFTRKMVLITITVLRMRINGYGME